MAKDALSVVQDVYGAFGQGDIPAILGMLTEDVAWGVEGRAGDYPTFGPRRGPAGALAFFQAMGRTGMVAWSPHSAGLSWRKCK